MATPFKRLAEAIDKLRIYLTCVPAGVARRQRNSAILLPTFRWRDQMKHVRFAITITTLASVSTCASAADAIKVSPPQQKMLSSPNARYVFGQISEYRRDQYMLDTQTGRLWQIVTRKGKNPDGSEAAGDGFSILDPVPYSDINGKFDLVPR